MTVCYPFSGQIDSSCELGLAQVKKVWAGQQALNGTVAIQQDSYWISRGVTGQKIGVWVYSSAASYLRTGPGPTSDCVVLFQGVAMYTLDPADPTKITSWLEAPDSDRIDRTYPCGASKEVINIYFKIAPGSLSY